MSVLTLLINVIIIALLVLTIGYCWLLNRRIKVLQDSKSELAQLLKHFDESTDRASESIIALQTASKKIGENIQMRIDKANYLLDDLSFMIDKGNRLSSNMEAGFAVDRVKNRLAHEEHEPQEPAAAAPPAPEPKAQAVEEEPSAKERTVASLEALLERVRGRSKPQEDKETKTAKAQAKARSRSEQELLDLLRAGGVKG